MNISKTTFNFAKARGLDIDTDFDSEDSKIAICVVNENVEPMFTLFASEDGSFSYAGNIWLDASVKEEIPAFIRDEKHLREVLAFVAVEMAQDIAEANAE